MMNEYIYLISYTRGYYEDHAEYNIFATDDLETALKYCAKFNTMLKKWKDYFNEVVWLDVENYDEKKFYDRACQIDEVHRCKMEQIRMR